MLVPLHELFEIQYGVNLELLNCDISSSPADSIPFVSRTSQNNGVSAYVFEIDGQPKNKKHTISVAGGGTVLASFYHPYDYYSGRDIFVLTPRLVMSDVEMLLYCAAIEANKYRYNYGRQANKTLKNIKVPARDHIQKSFSNIVHRTISVKSIHPQALDLNTNSWKTYSLQSLFAVIKGKRLTKENMEDGALRFIGSTEYNNGITMCIANDEHLHDGNCITVAYNGSVAQSFYQDQPFVASDDINILKPKDFALNTSIAMFLITLLEGEKYRYSYGRKWHKEKMEKSTLRLPTTPQGTPDWAFMERYIKSLPFSSNL